MYPSVIFSQDPIRPRSGHISSPGGADVKQALAGKRVVIVEDEGITQIQLRRLLTLAGLKVVGQAMTGEEAIAIVLRERPDIVVMDITMPGEINGLEAVRRILPQFSTCVVMITAYTEYKAEADAAGASGYVVKPIDSTSLLPQLALALKNWQGH